MPAVARKLEPAEKHDAAYLAAPRPRDGDIDIHEMAWRPTAICGWSTPASAACVAGRRPQLPPAGGRPT
jgi:hypothetical protein